MLNEYKRKCLNLTQNQLNRMLSDAGFKHEEIDGKDRVCRKWQGSQSVVLALVKKTRQGYSFKTIALPKIESTIIRGINNDTQEKA